MGSAAVYSSNVFSNINIYSISLDTPTIHCQSTLSVLKLLM